MTGLCGLDGDFSRFQVADLADHDHVRVLPEERPQRPGEGHTLFLVLLDLVDSVDANFDRILDGGNVPAFIVQQVERGIQRYRLTAEPVGPVASTMP